MSPEIQKQRFKNGSDGWVGAVVIGPKGDERGVAVEPGGEVWLSEAEQILTANAPRSAEDNPFLEQTQIRTDRETGERQEIKVTPLVPIEANRFVPANSRPIPADLSAARAGAVAQQAATAPEPEVPVAAGKTPEQREAEVKAAGEDTAPHAVLPPAGAAEAVAAAEAEPPPPTQPQVPTGPPAPPVPPQAPPAPPETPPAPEEPPVAPEETAAASPGPQAEETGAALPPQGPAPEGEFAQAEEVGTPEAAAQPPPPFTPPED